MRLTTILFLFQVIFAFGQTPRLVKGKVNDGKNPIENVNVMVVEKEIFTTTAKDGSYQIEVETGDVLQFSHTGLKTIRIQIEDVTRILNPRMSPQVNELEEVVVKGNPLKSQKQMAEEYADNKWLIRTVHGFVDAKTSAGSVRIVDGSQINEVSNCILNVIRNRFAGVRVFGDCITGGGVVIRGINSINFNQNAIYDIDGVISPEAPIWLLPSAIDRLAILPSLISATQYGSIGRGGVIVINTKLATSYYVPKDDDDIYGKARQKNNYTNEEELTQSELKDDAPDYLKVLEATSSFAEAKAFYENTAEIYRASPYFFLDSYQHFYETWRDEAYADSIIEDNYHLFRYNAVLLKALAYLYEAQGRFEKANKLFTDIFILRPNYAQSYMDIANNYRDINKPKSAASIYMRYGYLLDNGMMEPDSLSFGPMIEREFNNLLLLDKDAVVATKEAEQLFVAEEDFEGTRLVFEWNDSEAEFELQFVSPENQYFLWKHSLEDNEEIVMNGKRHGYSCTEHLIDDSLPGTWKVNVNYLGNKSLTPIYLKAKIYHNYGSQDQIKETKVYKLSVKNVNQRLFTIRKG